MRRALVGISTPFTSVLQESFQAREFTSSLSSSLKAANRCAFNTLLNAHLLADFKVSLQRHLQRRSSLRMSGTASNVWYVRTVSLDRPDRQRRVVPSMRPETTSICMHAHTRKFGVGNAWAKRSLIQNESSNGVLLSSRARSCSQDSGLVQTEPNTPGNINTIYMKTYIKKAKLQVLLQVQVRTPERSRTCRLAGTPVNRHHMSCKVSYFRRLKTSHQIKPMNVSGRDFRSRTNSDSVYHNLIL